MESSAGVARGCAPLTLQPPNSLFRFAAACGACEVCEIGDYACKSRNREKGGYLQLSDEELAEGETAQAVARMAADRQRA